MSISPNFANDHSFHKDGLSGHSVEIKTAAVKNFPAPKNTTNLKSFLRLTNQLGYFVLTHSLTALIGLLKKIVSWQWLPDQEKAFQNKTKILTGNLVLQPFIQTMLQN